ncbi:hypothetical protein BGZ94_005139, partial [Podila epigama]
MITGIDMSPMFPSTIIPSNCSFLQHNILEARLPFPDNHFDFVHQRFLAAALSPTHWTTVLSELERVTKPGGWIELVELDGYGGNNGPHMHKIKTWVDQMLTSRGIRQDIVTHPSLTSLLQAAQFTNVHQETLHLPIGDHGGQIGTLLKENEQALWHAIGPALLHLHPHPTSPSSSSPLSTTTTTTTMTTTTTTVVHSTDFEDAIIAATTEMETHKSFHILYIAMGQKIATDTLPTPIRPSPQLSQHHNSTLIH